MGAWYNKARKIKKIFWEYDLYENTNHEIAILELNIPYGTKHVDFKDNLGKYDYLDNYDSNKSVFRIHISHHSCPVNLHPLFLKIGYPAF